MIGAKNKKGFTLIEVLISLAIFSMVIAATLNFFYFFQKIQKRTENWQKISRESRLILDQIIQNIRENEIDYTYYNDKNFDLFQRQNILALRDFEGKPIIFQKSEEKEDLRCPQDKSPCLLFSRDGKKFQSLTSGDVVVRDFAIIIRPTENPFEFSEEKVDYLANNQPFVLVLLSLDNGLPENSPDYAKITLQTSVSSRVYKR